MAHISVEELVKRISGAKKKVKVGGFYVHYRHADRHYQLLNIALDEETEQPVVVYQSALDPNLI